MEKSLTAKILGAVSEGAKVSSALFVTILESGYGASHSKLQRNFYKTLDSSQTASKVEHLQKKRQNFYVLLSKLRREGLVQKKIGKWTITPAGRERLSKALNNIRRVKYKKEGDSSFKIVVFDVPEKDKKKREWLRRKLGELGFKMLQKSVWIGKVKLPEEFLEDLREYKILPYVDILAVTKSGSVRTVN